MGKLYPSKIGIALTPTRFFNLLAQIDEIQSNVDKLRRGEMDVLYKRHIGGGVYVAFNSDFLHVVNIRRFFIPAGEMMPIPTRRGIALRLSEWDVLVARLDEIRKMIPPNEKPCNEREDHQNPTIRFDCKDCNPFQSYFTQNY